MKKWIMLVIVSLLLAGHTWVVKADDIADLKQQMARQAELIFKF